MNVSTRRPSRAGISRVAPLVLVAGATLALTACPKKPAPAAPAPAPVNQDSINAANRMRDSLAALARARQDSIDAANRARQDSLANAQNALTAARSAVTAVILFDYDRSDLTDAARATLDAKVPVLAANPALRIRVAGHTDARGSDEYNLALGQRRAAAAKRYLTQHGVDASRIDVISYGEERPAAQGDDESAYSQNRRDEFEITAGGDNIVPARQ
ncbi:MAG TPA: peptidoglycan-associated lipoprotein Pal [Gemmatimonadaceae bacterium]|nr:peptidoglycan-associated lipoprotein Pal [Gemmatimonadaceae bacterium]